MRCVSLFAGVGGFDLGFERAGIKSVAQVEIDPKCRAILARHFPGAQRFEDVREVGAHNLPPADIVCGGFPCQDLSVAGRRAGLAGERSGLWWEFHRILDETRPSLCVLENVPGLLSSNGGRDMEAVVRSLVELGYRVCWRVLDSRYFGVAQRRRRVFIVGSLGDGRCAQILFEPESLRGSSEPSREARQVAPSLSASGVGAGRVKGNGKSEEVEFCIPIKEIAANQWSKGNEPGACGPGIGEDGDPMYALGATPSNMHGVAHSVNARMDQNEPHAEDLDTYIPAVAIRTANTGANGHGLAANMAHTLDQAQGQCVVHSVNARMDQNEPHAETMIYQWASGGGDDMKATAQALRAGAEHNYQFLNGPTGVRRLTPTECERLQGFPDGWADGQADSTRYRQMGNAVSVPVIEWIGRRIQHNFQ